jgi:hypothetical protein
MAKKKAIDGTKLIEAVESGRPSREIMAEFKLNTPMQLKTYYLDALVEKGKAKPIVGRQPKTAKAAEKAKSAVIGKRGSLTISRSKIEDMGFKIGDSFTILKTKVGISLRQE